METLKLGKEIKYGEKVFVLDCNGLEIDRKEEGYFVLDFNRKFEDPDINHLPAIIKLKILEGDK